MAVFGYVIASLVLAAGQGSPSTFYVRPDGGSAAQCDGRHDAPYTGHGRRRACAWRHPFEALPPGGPARIGGGDTLVIGAGSYRMGAGAPGTDALEKCRKDWPWDCHASAIPGGPSPDRPTRVLGAGYDSGCARPPELWGAERASTVLDLGASANVEIGCLELTDHSSCIEFYNGASPAPRCDRDSSPYGDWSPAGLTAAGASGVRLHDLNIHGLAHDGIRAGRLHDWTLERVRLVGNGWAGWNGDLGDGDAADSGTMKFRHVEIAWNGCVERYPDRSHSDCWGQETGGYGDGLGTGATGGDWLFDHVDVHDNTQDGIDLLHARSDARVVLRNVHAERNAGNQIKAGGSVVLTDSTVSGNCTAPGRSGLDHDDLCRAGGNAVSVHLSGAAQARIENNTISGEGDCLIGLICAEGACGKVSATIAGNRLSGARRKDAAEGKLACSAWVQPEMYGAKLEFKGNQLHATRSNSCPQGFTTCSGNEAH